MTKNFFLSDLNLSRSPAAYLDSIGLPPFEWQKIALSKSVNRLMLNCARQSGKSTVTAGYTLHSAKFHPRSLNIICAPSLLQAEETMKKVEDIAALDKDIRFEKSSTTSKQLENGSRVIALPGTERSVRGYSGPRVILLDEASRIEDETYLAIRPQLTGQNSAKLVLMSTPAGKTGFFFNEWENSKSFTKLLVKPAFKLNDEGTDIIPDLPEDEFKAYWLARGVLAFYSPRHTREWLREELDSMGAAYYSQEYDVSFRGDGVQLFSDNQISGLFGRPGADSPFSEEKSMDQDAEPFDFGGYNDAFLFGL